MIKEGNSSSTISNPSTIQVYFDRYIGFLGHPFHLSNSSSWAWPNPKSSVCPKKSSNWNHLEERQSKEQTWISRWSCYCRTIVFHQGRRGDSSERIHSDEIAVIYWRDRGMETRGNRIKGSLRNPNPRFEQRRRPFWKARRCSQLHSVRGAS